MLADVLKLTGLDLAMLGYEARPDDSSEDERAQFELDDREGRACTSPMNADPMIPDRRPPRTAPADFAIEDVCFSLHEGNMGTREVNVSGSRTARSRRQVWVQLARVEVSPRYAPVLAR
jgi:hypothetical protein